MSNIKRQFDANTRAAIKPWLKGVQYFCYPFLRQAYLDHMMEAAAYYDAKSRARMGRQVLLLHMNHLNSLYLDDLLQRFLDDGWSSGSVLRVICGIRCWLFHTFLNNTAPVC